MSEARPGQRRMGAQPVVVLSDDSERTHGRDAQKMNIAAGKAVAEAVRTTLGPRGMDKMLVSDSGDVVITNDGATILNEMDIEHPAAQMIVEVAETQEDEVGDGTTTASVLAGQLLSEAEDLLEQDVHPTTVVEGYHEAARIAGEAIEAETLDADVDDDTLTEVAVTSMTGKGTGDVTTERLAEIVVNAIRSAGGDRDEVRVHTQTGASSSATELVQGVVLDEEPAHAAMPREAEDASVAVLDVELDVRESEIDAEYNVTSVDQLQTAIESEESELRGYADAIEAAGIDVVFNEDDIEDRVASHLADRGILAFDGLDSDDVSAILEATGASQLVSVDDIEADDLGTADHVRTARFGDDELAFVEGAEAENVTVFARGGTEHVVNELERALTDALDVASTALDTGQVVPGAGHTEIAIADRIRAEAASVSGRKQLAVEAFADALDILPRTLAENAGMDPIDALVDLRAAYEDGERAGLIVEGRTGAVRDPVEQGVLDPAAVKKEAVESAAEAATMIVRIDDVIAAN